MPRNLSSAAIVSAQSTETDEVWLVLMEIEHADLAEPIYIVNNTVDIPDVVQPAPDPPRTYVAYPFNVILGNDDGEKLPTVKLTFDNVPTGTDDGTDLVSVIRGISDSPDITIKIVLSSQPDYVEIEISELKLREVTYDMYTISGILYADDILNQKWPKDNITKAAGYLGLFR